MNSRQASVKLSLVIDILRDDWSSKALDQLVGINLLEVKQYIDALESVATTAASLTKPNGGKLRSRISQLEAENKTLKAKLGGTARIVTDVVKAGESPNRYIPADVLHRARELKDQGLTVTSTLTVVPKKAAKKKGKKKAKKSKKR
jgi:hypothetical protein